MTVSEQPILPPLPLTARQLAKLYGVDQPPIAWAPVVAAPGDAEALALQARIVGEGPSRQRRQALALAVAGAATALSLQLVAHVAAEAIAGPSLGLPLAAAIGWALHRAQAEGASE